MNLNAIFGRRGSAALPFLCGLLLLVGCQTLNSPATSDRVARLAGLAADLGTRAVLAANPTYRPAFTLALGSLNVLIAAGNEDPAKFAEALQDLPINQLKGGDSSYLYISAAVVVWDEVSSVATGINKSELVRKTTLAVRDGLARALGQSGSSALPN